MPQILQTLPKSSEISSSESEVVVVSTLLPRRSLRIVLLWKSCAIIPRSRGQSVVSQHFYFTWTETTLSNFWRQSHLEINNQKLAQTLCCIRSDSKLMLLSSLFSIMLWLQTKGLRGCDIKDEDEIEERTRITTSSIQKQALDTLQKHGKLLWTTMLVLMHLNLCNCFYFVLSAVL